MQENSSRIAVVLDRSGSMESMREATVAGFNSFLRGQRDVTGDCTLKLVQFDDQYEVVFDKPLNDAPELTQQTFVPRGSTALLDAQGRTIEELGRELAAMPEERRPAKVIVLMITDGHENASTDYTAQRVANMVKHQREKYGWEFIYLGANQDAVKVAQTMNISVDASLTYAATPGGMDAAMSSTGSFFRLARSGALAVFTEEDRKAAMDS